MSIPIFISYSRKDSAAMEMLQEFLRSEGFEVLIDTKDILPGENWKTRLQGLIRKSDAIVFLMSNTSLVSEVCEWEVQTSSEFGKRILPVVIEQSITKTVPEKLQELNYLFLRSEIERDKNLKRLSDSLRANHKWVRYQTTLFDRAMSWVERGHTDDDLLVGSVLEEARDHLLNLPADAPRPPELLARFVRTSVSAEERRRDEDLRASEERSATERKLRVAAEARRLAAEARLVSTSRPDLAALLALQAWHADENETTMATLLSLAVKWPRAQQFVVPTGESPPTGAIAPNLNRISFAASGAFCLLAAGIDNKTITLLRAGDPPSVERTFRHDSAVVATAIDEERGVILLLSESGHLTILPTKDDQTTSPTIIQITKDGQEATAMIRTGSSRLTIAAGSKVMEFDYLHKRHTPQIEVEGVRAIRRLQLQSLGRVLISGLPDSRSENPNALVSTIVDLQDGRNQKRFEGNAISVNGGDGLLIADAKGAVSLVNLADREKSIAMKAPEIKANSWARSATGIQLAYAFGKTVEFAYSLKNGGFGHVNFWNASAPDPSHNGHTIVVANLPNGFGASFVSVGKDGSGILWSDQPGSVLLKRLPGDPSRQGGSICFSENGEWMCSYGNSGYLIWSCRSLKLTADGDENVAVCAFVSGRAIGILKTGEVLWLDTKEQIAQLPPVSDGRAEGVLAVVVLEDGTLIKLDLASGQHDECGKIERSKGVNHSVEVDAVNRRFGYTATKHSVIIQKFDDSDALELRAGDNLSVCSFSFLQGTDEIAICSNERTKIFRGDGASTLFDYGTGSFIGTPMMATSIANKEFVVFLEDLGGRLTFVDRQYRSIQAQLHRPTGDHVYQLRGSPTSYLLAVSGNGGLRVLNLEPETLVGRLQLLSGRALSSIEIDKYGIEMDS